MRGGFAGLCPAQAQGRCKGGGRGLARAPEDAIGRPDGVGLPREWTVGPDGADHGAYRGCVGADLLRAGIAGAAAAVRDGPGALSRGGAVDRDAGEPGAASAPAGRLERAQCRSWDAARRSHRLGRAGDPGCPARAAPWLTLWADLPHDPVLLECAALGLGPLVWRP